jgi:hypothetical protein
MATALKKTVVRKCEKASHNGRNFIVMLELGDTLAMRLAGKRTVYRGALEKIYWVLAKWHALDEAKKKAAEKKERKAFRAQGLT